ncbi:hypothetical protein K502DRAFT_323649 [Neoconidiobolus thromboides FSU 785]|nr:hypothetical protein K502DRAFT_323649 [Neoconidiobolus thromboides FSU 785]
MNHKEKTRGEQVSAPLVIFCSNCRAIVGDSYSWLGADSELRSFSLYDKSKEVIVNEELETSKQGIDIGSTFTTMNCSSCEAYLGKVYKTTPRSLDHIRDMYTFSIDKVSLYQLGPSEHSSDFFALKNEQMMDLPALSKLQDNMRKVSE